MKKILLSSIIALLLISLTSLTAFAQQSLKIGTDDWPPYEFKQNGKITGYCTEIVEQVFDNMDVKVGELEIYTWARAEDYVFKGKIDVLYSSSKSDKREKYVHFPQEPLISSDWVMFIRKADKNKLKFNSLADLKGKKVGVVRDYSYTPEFWGFIKKEKNYDEASNDQTNFKKLVAKRFDYLVSEYAVGLSIAKDLGIDDQVIALTGTPIKSTGLYVMFSKKTIDKPFVNNFSKELKKFKTTSAFKTLKATYLD